jgi:hypothetical protein
MTPRTLKSQIVRVGFELDRSTMSRGFPSPPQFASDQVWGMNPLLKF